MLQNNAIYFEIKYAPHHVKYIFSSRKHAFIILTPLNPTLT